MVQPIRIGESRSKSNTEKLGFIGIVCDLYPELLQLGIEYSIFIFSSCSLPSNTPGHVVKTEEQQRDHREALYSHLQS
ncbi:hypothetical protein Plhal710r2_c007g0034601 [Plasmopara halstedii]